MQGVYVGLNSCDPARAMFYGIHLSLFLTWSNQRTHLPLQSFESLTALSFTGRSHCSATAVLGQANLAGSREAVLPQNKRCAFRNCLVLGTKLQLPFREICFCKG